MSPRDRARAATATCVVAAVNMIGHLADWWPAYVTITVAVAVTAGSLVLIWQILRPPRPTPRPTLVLHLDAPPAPVYCRCGSREDAVPVEVEYTPGKPDVVALLCPDCGDRRRRLTFARPCDEHEWESVQSADGHVVATFCARCGVGHTPAPPRFVDPRH